MIRDINIDLIISILEQQENGGGVSIICSEPITKKCVFCEGKGTPCLLCKGRGFINIKEWHSLYVDKIQIVSNVKELEGLVLLISEYPTGQEFLIPTKDIVVNEISELAIYTDNQKARKDCDNKNISELSELVIRNLKHYIYSWRFI